MPDSLGPGVFTLKEILRDLVLESKVREQQVREGLTQLSQANQICKTLQADLEAKAKEIETLQAQLDFQKPEAGPSRNRKTNRSKAE